MPIQKLKQNFAGITYTLQQPNGNITNFEVDQNTWYPWSKTKRKGEIFNIGGGVQLSTKNYVDSGEFWLDYGSHVLRSQNDFTAWVQMWGAGGGGQHHEGNTTAGGGGYSQALVKFKAGIPYTITVGQAGDHGNDTTHGGGGRGHDGGGQGGGLSGIFMGSEHFGKTRWGHGTPPVTQAQGLIVAGLSEELFARSESLALFCLAFDAASAACLGFSSRGSSPPSTCGRPRTVLASLGTIIWLRT